MSSDLLTHNETESMRRERGAHRVLRHAEASRVRTGHPSPALPRLPSHSSGDDQGRLDSPGRVPERPKGSDCKSDGIAFTGSNPVPPTNLQAACSPVSFAATPTRSRVHVVLRSPLACDQMASARAGVVQW